MKLSVAMIVKNESAMLERCLNSVKDADEIIVVDTGSEDNTVEIAKKFTDKVYTDYKWEDNFAKARNHAISKCTGDWILSIDADDILEEGGIAKIRKVIEAHPEQFCFNVQFVTEGGEATHSIPYLYKNCKEVYFCGAAHNYLSIPASIHSNVKITYGHSPAHKKDPDRTLRILKKAVDENMSKPREMFYLAREYRYRSLWIPCLYWCDQYLKIATWGPERADGFLMKARALWNLKRGEEARDACLQAIKINANFKEALLFMTELCSTENRDNWLFMAELADNRDVLFTRNRVEKNVTYYETLHDNEPRYDNIYHHVGTLVNTASMLDIGCGQGNLKPFVKNYDGFDWVTNPYRTGNIYTESYGDYDVYVLLEVLEHLTHDMTILKKIPSGKRIIFSVPSFDCPSHVRMYTREIVYWRYRDIIDVTNICRYNFNSQIRKWELTALPTREYILLIEAIRK
jgi:glycosyltransferase involved in cell wall biosynthesis